MKQAQGGKLQRTSRGRPFTGAWIETDKNEFFKFVLNGRPFTGAWIETLPCPKMRRMKAVAPSRGRGLKQCSPYLTRI